MGNDDAKDKLFLSLVELFRPHVAAVKMPKIIAWASSPYGDEEKKASLGFSLSPLLVAALAAWHREKTLFRGIVGMIGETVKVIFNRPRLSEKQIDADLMRWVNEATGGFVRGWLVTLRGHARNASNVPFDPRTLDGAMLPVASASIDPTAIIGTYDTDQLSAAEIRGILRAVKATLPPGQHLPAEAVEHLRLDGVTFVA